MELWRTFFALRRVGRCLELTGEIRLSLNYSHRVFPVKRVVREAFSHGFRRSSTRSGAGITSSRLSALMPSLLGTKNVSKLIEIRTGSVGKFLIEDTSIRISYLAPVRRSEELNVVDPVSVSIAAEIVGTFGR